MATPNERLAASLSVLQKLQAGGSRVFRSNEFTRVHRERLRRSGFLQNVLKGWLISTSPGASPGDSTPWFASFWEFCVRYCNERFRVDWHLSPEQSLLLHAENTVIPAQVIVYSSKGTNNNIKLLFGTSLYDLKQNRMPLPADVVERDGLRLFAPTAALVKVPEAFFERSPVEAQVVLATFRDASDLLRRLLDGGNTVVAGRLAGALRRMARPDLADEIVSAMKSAGYDVRESDPFAPQHTFGQITRPDSPIVGRIQGMWASMREVVQRTFPKPPGLPSDRAAYLRYVDEIYKRDAYHSLSIEGYRVTPELIERVRSGAWNPDQDGADRQNRDALAARGYWQAFQSVKNTVAEIIAGGNAGALTRQAHREWYRELFQPCVGAGLVRASALAGYRNDFVFLRTSRPRRPPQTPPSVCGSTSPTWQWRDG